MQQQQLAAQLAHHGGQTRQPPLSPTPSDSDSDISLGAHSPPLSSSPGAPSSRYGSPGPFRFGNGPHSPGSGNSGPLPPPPHFRFGSYSRKSPPEETTPRGGDSPIRVDSPSPQQTTLTQQPSPPPLALNMRLGEQLTTPLRIQVASPGKLVEHHHLNHHHQTSLHVPPHGGIVRIAPPHGQHHQPLQLHRPFSPPRLT